MRPSRPILAALLASLAVPGAAHAAFFPAEVIDGPNADVVSVGDLDLSRDGTGGVVYVKKQDGVNHVFLSRLVDGAFQAPERMDNGLAPASSQPVIAASNDNRMAVAWVNDGTLFTSVKAKDATGFSAPAAVASGGVSNPALDMSINGASYVTFTLGGDVRAARAERDNPAYTVLSQSMDVDASRDAGNSDTKRSRVVVSADGTALVTWGETGADGRSHVYARRLFEQRPSQFPQDLTLDSVDGATGTGAELPEVDIEDDSSYAQVVFRQNTTNGPRVVMRRLVGSAFEAPTALDSGAFALRGRVDLTGRGEGLFGVGLAGGEVFGGTLFNNAIKTNGQLAGGSAVDPQATPAVGENEDGAVAWIQGGTADASVHARYYDGVEFPKLEPDTALSNGDFGAVDAKAGFDAAASRAGDVATVWVQGTGDQRRLVAGIYDRPPSRMAGSTTEKVRKLTKLRWAATLNLFGAVTYRILVDGKQVAETRGLEYVPAPGQIADGQHAWQVVAIDRRGQQVVSRTRQLRVDNTPPSAKVTFKKRRRTLSVAVRAGDPDGALPSGLNRVLVDFGDGKLLPMRSRTSKTYARNGRYTVRVKVLDKAGNEAVVQRRVQIG